MGLGPWEIIIIFVVVLLLFGGKKLPEFARGLGEGIKEFKSYPQVNTTKVVREDVKKQPSGIHCLRGCRRE